MQLRVYEFKTHPLLQITSGQLPHTFEEDASGWRLVEGIDSTAENLTSVARSSPSQILLTVERQGYVSLSKVEISEEWLSIHVEHGGL